MHVPNPLGSYPLVLRDYDVSGARRGEFLLDYKTYDLYYINRSSGERISVAEEIYQRILKAKLQNTKIVVADKDKEAPWSEDPFPPIADRHFNTFYYVVELRTKSKSPALTIILDLSKTSAYVIDTTLYIPDEVGYVLGGNKLVIIADLDEEEIIL